jgi:hypothetical protein
MTALGGGGRKWIKCEIQKNLKFELVQMWKKVSAILKDTFHACSVKKLTMLMVLFTILNS